MTAARPARPGAFQSLPASRLSRRVVKQFQELVRRGELLPGDRLPPERELAQRFGVGRNSVREALRELDMIGLVVSRQGEGTFVRAPDAIQLMAPFRTLVELSSPAAESILEFRLAFEPGVAELAARNLTEDGRRRLGSALDTFEASLIGPQDHAEHSDAAFHFAVAQVTRNPTVIAVHQALLELLTTSRGQLDRTAYQPHDPAAIGHRELYDAIASQDEAHARGIMHEHLVHVARCLPGPGDKSDTPGQPGVDPAPG